MSDTDTFILNMNDEHEFMTCSDNLLEQGYIMSSSSCGVLGEAYDYQPYFIAIFVKQNGEIK